MSSDSEDDFYGNMVERLQKEKEKIFEDKTETLNLLDDSNELDEIVKNNEIPVKTAKKRGRKAAEEIPGCSQSDLPSVSMDNTSTATSKRMTRSRAKSSGDLVPTSVELPSKRARRGRNSTNTTTTTNITINTATESSCENSTESNSTPNRGRGRGGRARGRGRARTPRTRRRWRGMWAWTHEDYFESIFADILAPPTTSNHQNRHYDPSIPIYSIGNTEEYPDQSHSQPLFSKPKQTEADNVVIVEDENVDDNEELSVKVYWQSSEFFKFTIRKFQKLAQIFDYFAKKENVSHNNLLLTYNDKILKPDDTPESIDYSIVKFIDGGIVSQGVSDLVSKDDEKIKDGIKLKFQCQNLKKPVEVTVRKTDKLSVAMMKCSELLEKPLDKLKFEFDGDSISGKSTADDLEFEGGECIDVKIVS